MGRKKIRRHGIGITQSGFRDHAPLNADGYANHRPQKKKKMKRRRIFSSAIASVPSSGSPPQLVLKMNNSDP